ncbi:MAG: 30S ribosomal protein S19 [Candidatus Woesearchaeota archaeon]|nr:MAG: 30S ribosomal protein S19 [Candidatus Woesearchaeota archaeon]
MARKDFTYRGKSVEELQALARKDIALLFPARQRRKIIRGFSEEEEQLIEKLTKKNNVKTHHRDMIVFPAFVGKTIRIHNGKEFVPVEILPEMISSYLGELVLTRRRLTHAGVGVGASRSSAGAKKK